MKIQWNKTETQSYQGVDEVGNKYFMPANQETCVCEMPDGKRGSGWTPQESLSEAVKYGKTHKDRLKVMERCIDDLIEIGSYSESDYHEIVGSCESFVSKIRRLYDKVEEKTLENA